MLTKQKVQEQIAELEKEAGRLYFKMAKDRKRHTQIGKTVKYLQEIVLMLETNPSREHIERERLRAQDLLQKYNTPEHLKRWAAANKSEAECKNPKAVHDRIFRIKDLQRHYKNAGYILQVDAK